MSIDTLSPRLYGNGLDERPNTDALIKGEFDELDHREVSTLFARNSSDDRITELNRQKRDMLLECMVENPAAAFRWEAEQLGRLYEGRTFTTYEPNGRIVHQFCTQNHRKQCADYVFKRTISPDGSEFTDVSKVMSEISGEPCLYRLRLKGEILSAVAYTYRRGKHDELEITGALYDEVVARFFEGTIRASALQYERTPEEIRDNDLDARKYLGQYLRTGLLL